MPYHPQFAQFTIYQFRTFRTKYVLFVVALSCTFCPTPISSMHMFECFFGRAKEDNYHNKETAALRWNAGCVFAYRLVALLLNDDRYIYKRCRDSSEHCCRGGGMYLEWVMGLFKGPIDSFICRYKSSIYYICIHNRRVCLAAELGQKSFEYCLLAI